MRLVTIEQHPGGLLVICHACTWRELVPGHGSATVQAAAHLRNVHDEHKRAGNLAHTRRKRGQA